MKTLIGTQQLQIMLQRLAHQLAENHEDFSGVIIVGIQPRGVPLAERLVQLLRTMYPGQAVPSGTLDITFHRDDLHSSDGGIHLPAPTRLPASIAGKQIILVDDVLYTGRTIRAAMDALLAFGRPLRVELLTLIDRRYSRELPVQPDYTGYAVDTITAQKVKVKWLEADGVDEVVLIN